MQGTPWSDGYVRGNIRGGENEDGKILIIDNDNIPDLEGIEAIVTNQLDLQGQLSSGDIPVVYLEDLNGVRNSNQVSVNGYLGFVIVHDVR